MLISSCCVVQTAVISILSLRAPLSIWCVEFQRIVPYDNGPEPENSLEDGYENDDFHPNYQEQDDENNYQNSPDLGRVSQVPTPEEQDEDTMLSI